MNRVLDKVKLMLRALNITVDGEKEFNLQIIYELELEKLLNYLNREELPKGLTYTLANRVLGRFLLNNLSLGKYEDINNLEFSDLLEVVEIREYETHLKYGKNQVALDNKKLLEEALKEMLKFNNSEINRYRLIVWN